LLSEQSILCSLKYIQRSWARSAQSSRHPNCGRTS